jgi:hypothetical protein
MSEIGPLTEESGLRITHHPMTGVTERRLTKAQVLLFYSALDWNIQQSYFIGPAHDRWSVNCFLMSCVGGQQRHEYC